MRIRPLAPPDIADIATLLNALAVTFIVHDSPPDAAATFLRQQDAAAIRANIAAGMAYHVAEIDGALAGFIGVRDRSHVYHLFVDQAYHRRGVARALWHAARDAAGHAGPFTVNSSTYALPTYEALGFVRTLPMQVQNGIAFHPMRMEGGAGA
jgi:GNAT superfamily N-acetyltransferase